MTRMAPMTTSRPKRTIGPPTSCCLGRAGAGFLVAAHSTAKESDYLLNKSVSRRAS